VKRERKKSRYNEGDINMSELKKALSQFKIREEIIISEYIDGFVKSEGFQESEILNDAYRQLVILPEEDIALEITVTKKFINTTISRVNGGTVNRATGVGDVFYFENDAQFVRKYQEMLKDTLDTIKQIKETGSVF
jgi:hypothetical protein